jgi:hypothetical protein
MPFAVLDSSALQLPIPAISIKNRSYKNSWNYRKIDPEFLEFQAEIPQGLIGRKADKMRKVTAQALLSLVV